MDISADIIITVLASIGGFITVWVNLNSRLTLLEARLDFGGEKFNAIDKKFDEVMTHLRRIEDKLDNKVDRS
jgi:plasmid maintenance system antidote protein VapI